MSFLFCLFLVQAHAGGWSQACAKFFSKENWIADDPYQFEDLSPEWLERQIGALEIKVRWSKATQGERNRLILLYNERDKRRALQAIIDEHK